MVSNKKNSGCCMKNFWVHLKSINEVKEFVSIVNTCKNDVDLISGRYIVDAKSIMGIFSLDLSQPIQVRLQEDNDDTIIEKLTPFIME